MIVYVVHNYEYGDEDTTILAVFSKKQNALDLIEKLKNVMEGNWCPFEYPEYTEFELNEFLHCKIEKIDNSWQLVSNL